MAEPKLEALGVLLTVVVSWGPAASAELVVVDLEQYSSVLMNEAQMQS